MTATVIEMQPAPSVKQLASEYTRLGWKLCVIKHGTKSPEYEGWNTAEKAIASATQLPDTPINIGLLHAFSGTCSIDLDQIDLAAIWLAERGIKLDDLLNAADAVQINSGRENSGKLIYRLTKPLPSKRIVVDGGVALELRCASASGLPVQDVLPPSRHPEGSDYQWAGAGDWRHLPVLPDAILKVWETLIESDKEPRYQCVQGEHNASIEEITSAVMACDPNSDRTPWRNVGMALKKELNDDGFDLWDRWSQQSAKYPGVREMGKQWRSFNNSHPNPITLGTVFFNARNAGWVRPPHDVARLFAAIIKSGTLKSPEEVIAELFPATPKLDLMLLPPKLRNYAGEISRTIGCDPVVPTLSGIVAVSAAANKESVIHVNQTFEERPIIRALTIGPPSDKKTPASKPMFAPLRTLEAEDTSRYESEILQWSGKEARHAADMKAFITWQQSPEAQMPNAVPPTVMGLPPKPEPLRLVVDDITSQKCATMLQHRPRGLTVMTDEARNWLTRATDPRSGDNLSFWTSSYGGGYYPYDRQGAGSLPIPNCAVSIYGNVQPDVLTAVLPKLAVDGGHARFLFGALNNEGTSAGILDDVPAFMSFKDEYSQMIRSIYATPKTTYLLTPEARQQVIDWNQWSTDAAKVARRAGKGMIYESAVGKLTGLVLRLSLLFHMMTSPSQIEVEKETVVRVITFVRDFVLPQYDYIDGSSIGNSVQQWVVNYILKHCDDADQLTLSNMQWALEKNKRFDMVKREREERITDAMDDLNRCGWTSRIDVKNSKTIRWMINPNIKVLFADRIRSIKAAIAEYKFNQ